MKKLLFLCMLPGISQAVEVRPILGNEAQSLHSQVMEHQLLSRSDKHERYQVTYKGLPVWGYHLIKHHQGKTSYTGFQILGLEKEIPSIESQFAAQDIINQYSALNAKHPQAVKIIYIDKGKARLAYHLKYYMGDQHHLSQPNKIIDANSGKVLKSYDSLHRQRIGQGMGGNLTSLEHRDGLFQYGSSAFGWSSLGRFDVTVENGRCIVANQTFEIINMQNKAFDWDMFPIVVDKEQEYEAFSYLCNKKTQYVNKDDGGYAPAHEGISPINDSMYFSQTTLDMYQMVYGDDKPFGDDLPIRVYTHLANLDNAFSIGTEYEQGKLLTHQQVVIGNGDMMFAPMSQTTIPHELSHNVTSNYSDLIYEGQSGAINEAFSDMADLALRSFLRRQFAWYWDGEDWTIGREETLSGEPLRYMEKPSDDGFSIDSAKDYYEGIDVHLASGVFNRAFYLLAHQPDWDAEKAFQVMFDANRYYWMPNSNYDYAACGVIRATEDLNWDSAAVKDAFAQVDVHCPLS